MSDIRLELQSPPVPADEAAIVEGLRTHNLPFLGPDRPSPFTLVARSDDGSIVGGLVAFTRWDRMFVDTLWVGEAVRGQRLGSRLLEAAEAEALRRGMRRAWLDTISFQARPFYEKHGYRVFAQQDDYPPGFTQYFMRKDLVPATR